MFGTATAFHFSLPFGQGGVCPIPDIATHLPESGWPPLISFPAVRTTDRPLSATVKHDERTAEVGRRGTATERPQLGLAGSWGRVPSPNNSKSLSAFFRVPLPSIGHFGEEQSGRDFWNAKPAVGLQRDRGGKVPVRRSFSGRPRRLRLPNNQAFTVHALPKRG